MYFIKNRLIICCPEKSISRQTLERKSLIIFTGLLIGYCQRDVINISLSSQTHSFNIQTCEKTHEYAFYFNDLINCQEIG